jgi:hypothetical protein
MGTAAVVERRIEAQNFVIDPCLFTALGRLGAGAHDLTECTIGGYSITAVFHRTRQPSRDMKAIKRDDTAFIRRYPVKRGVIAPFRHGK